MPAFRARSIDRESLRYVASRDPDYSFTAQKRKRKKKMANVLLPSWMCAGPRRNSHGKSIDPSTSLTFVTYNVLADALTGNEAGFSSETEDLAFENRAGKLLKKIFPREDEEETNVESDSTSNPDVICLQECDHYYDFFEPEMQKRGYFGTYREDKWSPCQKFSNELKDGLALFCKRETVELVGMHISTTAETKEQDAKALFARLIMKKSLTRQEVVVINAHLESGQSPDKVVTRVNQAKEMCARLNAFCVAQCSNINTVQIVVCGDFNATPEEPCMEHLRGRGLKSAYEDLESASSSSKNGEQGQQQPEQQKVEGEPFFTTFKTRLGFFKNGTSKRVSDYIMYSAHRGAKIVSRVEPQQDGFGEGVVGLPSKTQPSDHLCLRSRLSFEHPIITTPTSNNAGAQAK